MLYDNTIEDFLAGVIDEGLEYTAYYTSNWDGLKEDFPGLYEDIQDYCNYRDKLAKTVRYYADRYGYKGKYISGLEV